MLTLQSRFATMATACTLVVCLFSVTTAKADLTSAIWEISASDSVGRSWSGSTLHFLTESPVGADHSVSGYFEWTSNDGRFGQENFAGTLFSNNHLSIDGNAIVQPASGIILSHYEADLTSSGTQLINGFWTIGAPGVWSATAVPEPETYAMLLAGLGLVGFMSRRRKNSVK